MFLFYKEDLMIADMKGGWDFNIDGPEAKHMINSLRLDVSDKVLVTNGRGYIVEGEIISKTKKECKILSLNVDKVNQKDFHLHIAIAPTKNISRFEWFIEKAVEFGIDEITPVICQNSVRRKVKTERSERIVISAMKQSYKAWKTIVNEAIDYDTFISKNQLAQKFIAHYEDENQDTLLNIAEKKKDTLIIIGPEGDFSENELISANNNNYKAISLSESRLRTETAALAATFTINLINQ